MIKAHNISRHFRFYDNGGRSADRYTAVKKGPFPWKVSTERDMLGLSDQPFHPQGFFQHCRGNDGNHLGTRVKFSDLPEKVQQAIKQGMDIR